MSPIGSSDSVTSLGLFLHKSPIDTVIISKHTTLPEIDCCRHNSTCIESPVYSLRLHMLLIIFVSLYVCGDIITRGGGGCTENKWFSRNKNNTQRTRIAVTCNLHAVTCHLYAIYHQMICPTFLNPLTAILFNLNFHPLKVVSR